MKTLRSTALASALLTTATLMPQAPAESCLVAPDSAIIAGSNQETAMDFYQKIAAKEGNVFFSPYSLSSALGMVYSGARGETEAEMKTLLHFTLDQKRIPNGFYELNAKIQKQNENDGPKLHIANALCQTGGSVNADYQKLLKDSYNAEIFNGDLNAINQWVSKKTEKKIDKILTELDPNSVCVLLNAIYFKGNWNSTFKTELTKSAPFHLSNGSKTDAPMMHRNGSYRLLAIPDAHMIEIPYQGDTMSMVIILPDAVDGLSHLEKQFTSANLGKWSNELHQQKPQSISLSLPKFKMDTGYNLVDTCKALGMNKAFQADQADFSGIAGTPGAIYISQIMHKAVLEVNEAGTEAAAATAVEMATRSASLDPTVFCADHPFLFLIRDHATNSILFMGRLENPKSEPQPPICEPIPVNGADQPHTAGYIITFKDGTDTKTEVKRLTEKYTLKVTHVYESALNGCAVESMTDETLEKIRREPSIKAIEHDGIATVQ